MKILAMYLPQYHAIRENDKWWGEGYTEWTAVKNARPLFAGHQQPKVPLNHNYYDLVKQGVQTWKWQAELANQYNIYGFCIYHYWFCGKQLLEKPMEILRDTPEIDINYCICWANETWRRNWYNQEREILVEQTYGDAKDWKQHFEYLLSFFKDKRYIKIDNKPVVHIYHSQDISKLKEMLDLWNNMARMEGFAGIYLISGATSAGIDMREDLIDAHYYFEPGYTLKNDLGISAQLCYNVQVAYKKIMNRFRGKKHLEHIVRIDTIWRRIEKRLSCDGYYPGTFPMWDNTPRAGNIGLYYSGSTPERFKKHLKNISEKYLNYSGYLYINAWNEWGEGAYLEPDELNLYGYLNAIEELNL